MVYTLIYKSHAIMDFGRNDLQHLLSVARKNNASLGITGMLLYSDKLFIQVLEGEQDVILSMYKTIQEDTRHIDVSVLFEDTIEKRMFPDWAMGYKNLNKDELANIPGLTQFLTDTKTATPYELLLQFRNNPAQFN